MSIKNIYSNLERSLEKTISESRARPRDLVKADSAFDSASGLEGLGKSFDFLNDAVSMESIQESVVNQHYGVKEIVRRKFGKHGKLMPTFGCHPDFSNMKEGELRNGYAITMFMDIIGSTKLGVIFTPDIVFRIKNDIIRCTIETVNSFDGHVHRIMGDAVMAFFRSDINTQEGRIADSAVDAINCATYLIEMFKSVVIPKLNDLGVDENLGIRIGIDYGANDQVVWGVYGYQESREVTATSFFVDVAAKLQQKAPKNCIMIGDSLAQLLGLDDNQLSIKTVTKSNETVPVKYITPNYKDAQGNPINYKQFILKNEFYLKLLPTSIEEESFYIRASLKDDEDDVSDDEYYPCSRTIKKGRGISFKGYFHSGTLYKNPRFKFRVVNTGSEASKNLNNGNHEAFENATFSSADKRYFAKHWEETAYKGLHHMYVSFWDGEQPITNEQCFSVFINE
ncbi:adenylate/guanylate cyclase domain-containing protein [Klebsiella pneumoniae]|uniref:adenylate/guanylate cyclase domain-containing protein n=2 Tax=Klebsiella pneumoniae TaxID=573 RepID=UPI00124A9DB1|nr:adenylate/guanylate cyclase domain-containing protein [Klebsiella pneumoniae]KAB1525279.1 adenylate/guanylate cyclase domain-containing protein [Klebsiella pneumoniae]KAB1559190.1 adenylate/guanylate cyclase domain-containing protein [Klebsiella pneumoniae]MCJ3355476.1 adenylate/guanylate cyclase domain-containing protein [Klebsiella pneumoniae]MCJ3383114.1 adenylate/guanylate cyclase domain-containing protein [Klebsiella pneumoniae]HBS1483816.1 adenylate/guanylate cyclase domain-containing